MLLLCYKNTIISHYRKCVIIVLQKYINNTSHLVVFCVMCYLCVMYAIHNTCFCNVLLMCFCNTIIPHSVFPMRQVFSLVCQASPDTGHGLLLRTCLSITRRSPQIATPTGAHNQSNLKSMGS